MKVIRTFRSQGFTLIELLIVIAVIAILAAVVFVALDPLTRFQESRDATRWSDVTAILDAAKVDQVDNGGAYVAAIAGMSAGDNFVIGTCAAAASCTAVVPEAACVDLADLVTEGYLAEVPMDPSTGTAADTDYYMSVSATGVLTVGACEPEGADPISVSR